MDKRSDRGEFYPGGDRSGGAPAPQPSDKVDRVNLGEVGESYMLKDVKEKVNQIVRVIAPAAVCLAIAVVRLLSYAATAPLEDIPNTAPVVTNEEDAVALATLGTATNSLLSRMSAGMSELRSDMNTASNKLASAISESIAAESNRVESTYARRSEIPAAPELAPYALKSELPRDYITENDITNFATRAWISAQEYATEAEMRAKIEAQDLRIGEATNAVWRAMGEGTNRLWAANAAASNRVNAATNAIWIAHKADANALRATDTAASNRVNAATNAIWIAMRAESNRLETAKTTMDAAWRAGTNATMRALRAASNELARADARLDAKIDALELTGGNTRLWTSDARRFQDATGVVWQVQVVTGMWTVAHSWTTEGMSWNGPWWWGEEGTGEDYYDGPGWYISSSSLTSMKMSEEIYESQIVLEWTYWGEEAHSITTTCSRTVQWLTNAVNSVAYTNDVAAAIWRLQDEGTVRNAKRLYDTMTGEYVTYWDVRNAASDATNYTEAVAAEFENGTRQVDSAQYAGSSADAMFAYKVSGDNWNDQYNANELIRASTNAARAVVGTATNGLQEAIGRKQDRLPYPTNAIPYAAISGAPSSGGQEWRVVNYDVEVDVVNYVTNGIAILTFVNAGYAYDMNVSTNGWPEGASMFVRGSFRAGATYTIPYDLRLIGYGTWPTNNFQSVWWRSGTNIYVNVILEE